MAGALGICPYEVLKFWMAMMRLSLQKDVAPNNQANCSIKMTAQMLLYMHGSYARQCEYCYQNAVA